MLWTDSQKNIFLDAVGASMWYTSSRVLLQQDIAIIAKGREDLACHVLGDFWLWQTNTCHLLCSLWNKKRSRYFEVRWKCNKGKIWLEWPVKWNYFKKDGWKRLTLAYIWFVMEDIYAGHNFYVRINMNRWVQARDTFQLDYGLALGLNVVENVVVTCWVLHKEMISEMEMKKSDICVGCGSPLPRDGIWFWGGDWEFCMDDNRSLATQWESWRLWLLEHIHNSARRDKCRWSALEAICVDIFSKCKLLY